GLQFLYLGCEMLRRGGVGFEPPFESFLFEPRYRRIIRLPLNLLQIALFRREGALLVRNHTVGLLNGLWLRRVHDGGLRRGLLSGRFFLGLLHLVVVGRRAERTQVVVAPHLGRLCRSGLRLLLLRSRCLRRLLLRRGRQRST